MAHSPDRKIILELAVRSAHPALLEGLDIWLQLGLISDETVRRIARDQLSCVVRQSAPVPVQPEPPVRETASAVEEVRPSRLEPARSPSRFAQMMQSFMAEISVIWLLFLGVFMVVVSSGVLAASQWRNFDSVGQYLILLGYTLAFWVATLLTQRRPTLRLTSRMLEITTLLIIPVNFWMMDRFQLLTRGFGLVVAAIAALLLTAAIIFLLKPSLNRIGNSWVLAGSAIFLSWLHWGWGWQGFPLIATYLGTVGAVLAVVYEDSVGKDGEGGGDEADRRENSSTLNSQLSTLHSSHTPLASGLIAVAFGALLLIARAMFVAQVPVNRLGLAIGICGWGLCWLGRRDATRFGWVRAGAGLLLLGWLVSVTVTPPWQAIVVSCLGLWLLADYLRRSGQSQYLIAGFLVGLQIIWLLWRIISPDWQQRVIDISIRLAGAEAMPFALIGIGFFPYLLLTVWLAFRLRRSSQLVLAKQAEWLALGLGVVLAVYSFGNPLTRLVNLTLSTLTLAAVIRDRREPDASLIYLTHGVGLGATASAIIYFLPDLSLNYWAMILLMGMGAEWGFSVGGEGRGQRAEGRGQRAEGRGRESRGDRGDGGGRADGEGNVAASGGLRRSTVLYSEPSFSSWRQSAWHFGLVLAVISYVFLQNAFEQEGSTLWSVGWLLTPIALTGLSYQRRFPPSLIAGWLSVGALVMVQLLTFDQGGTRLIGLGTATVLMLLNTQRLQHWLSAVLTVGFGLTFAAATLWEIFDERLTFAWAMNLLAIAILSLWLLRAVLLPRRTLLASLYTQATDGWAIALTWMALFLLTLTQFVVYIGFDSNDWRYLTASLILLGATGFRLWQSLYLGGLYQIAGSIELVALSAIGLTSKSLDALAITNIALGLGSQLLGDWWMNRQRAEGRGQRAGGRSQELQDNSQLSTLNSQLLTFFPFSLHLIPLIYAAIGVLIQHRSFTASTGLYTVAAALVGIGVGRRQPRSQPLTYLSVLAVSFGAYELLLYQLSQAKGGSPGDAGVLLAALAAFIAIALRFSLPWLLPYLCLPAAGIQTIAHLHWLLGSIFLVVAIAGSLSRTGEWGWVGIAATLTTYALASGRERILSAPPPSLSPPSSPSSPSPQPSPSSPPSPPSPPSPLSPTLWTYLGIIQAVFTLAYLLHILFPEDVLIDWAGAIASVIAFILYQQPWQSWGWRREPWRNSALLLPGVVIGLTGWGITVQSLLAGAAFYAWVAKAEQQARISYLSVLLADWAIARWLHQLGVTEPLWYVALISASLLYVAQIDPELRSSSERNKRHLLRCLATALVCLTAIYQAEAGISGLLPIAVSMISLAIAFGFILAGIFLRVRAFLYVGTLAFIMQLLRQLWLFINDYSLLLWAMGIALGLSLIWVAATFEARRSQISTLVQYWATELDEWD